MTHRSPRAHTQRWKAGSHMTRTKTYILTAVSAVLYLFLAWAFADGLFALDNLFSGDYYAEYTIWTYLMLAAIVGAGLYPGATPSRGWRGHRTDT